MKAVERPCELCGQHPDPAVYRRVWERETPMGVAALCDSCEYRNPQYQWARGRVCHDHFPRQGADGSRLRHSMADVLACAACQAALDEENERIQRTETIDPDQEYGRHIALYCVNHPELRWSTKNISHIGARSIFFAGDHTERECACPGRDLRVVKGGGE